MTLKDAEKMATGLMKYHGVHEYSFGFMERRTKFSRAGQCHWYKKKLIQLQPTFVELNAPVLVKQVLLHEIAHALRPRHNHNKWWKQTAKAIGCVMWGYHDGSKGLRCYGKLVKNNK